jgi:hypothetical protein
MDFKGVNDSYWVLTIYDSSDSIISQEVLETEDKNVATDLAYKITEGTVEYDEGWDWSMMKVSWWNETI